MDLKEPGNTLFLVGATRDELAASHLSAVLDADAHWAAFAAASSLPRVDLAAARATFTALHGAIAAGLVRACHDLSEGGLAVAAAEMAIAGGLGLALELDAVDAPGGPLVKLFSETPSRFLVEVAPDRAEAFAAALSGLPVARVGTVNDGTLLSVRAGGAPLLSYELGALRATWKSGLNGIDL
jgi:phosphoribosylformylglycinamidine synthase